MVLAREADQYAQAPKDMRQQQMTSCTASHARTPTQGAETHQRHNFDHSSESARTE